MEHREKQLRGEKLGRSVEQLSGKAEAAVWMRTVVPVLPVAAGESRVTHSPANTLRWPCNPLGFS